MRCCVGASLTLSSGAAFAASATICGAERLAQQKTHQNA
jgi:hypothetical protein